MGPASAARPETTNVFLKNQTEANAPPSASFFLTVPLLAAVFLAPTAAVPSHHIADQRIMLTIPYSQKTRAADKVFAQNGEDT